MTRSTQAILLYCFLLSAQQSVAQMTHDNYVKSKTALIPNAGDLSTMNDATEVVRSVSYFDGLGRILQTVSVQGSPLNQDIVQPVIYDAFGRRQFAFLPYVSTESDGSFKADIIDPIAPGYINGAATFYNDPASTIPVDTRPFNESVFETSALSRLTKSYGPGDSWFANNRFVKIDNLINSHGTSTDQEKIINWKLDATNLPIRATPVQFYVETGGYYSSGHLTIKSTKDEQGNEVREYTDKSGRVVSKKVQFAAGPTLSNREHWAQTYYIYDDSGNLRFVLPPELAKLIHQNDVYNPTTTDLNTWAFQYIYDGRNRMTHKRVPGAGWVYMVYDKRDRLVFTQDANQRVANKWSFIKYDALNRTIITGIYQHGTEVDQQGMSALISETVLNETYDGNQATHGYTNTVFNHPDFVAANFDVYSVSYYDKYDFKSLMTSFSAPEFQLGESDYKSDIISDQYEYDIAVSSFPRVMGLLTGAKIRILESPEFLWSLSYYDDKKRVVQSISSNNVGGVDVATNNYDFTGKVTATHTSHRVGSTTHRITRNYEYDHRGRLLKVWHKIDDDEKVILYAHEYNEIGQLARKKLHGVDDPALEEEGTAYSNTSIEVSQYNDERKIVATNSVVLKPGFFVPEGKVFTARTERNWSTVGNDPPDEHYTQIIDYSYNIRNWLERVNDVDDTGDDLFAMKLAYQDPSSKGGLAQFNGNISEMEWSNAGFDKQSFGYSYDPLNRLTQASYYDHMNPEFDGRYNEEIMPLNGEQSGYDLNGNIRHLMRWGKKNASQHGLMDDLTYTYVNTGNQMSRIDDAILKHEEEGGFKEEAKSDNEYLYDANGNLRRDDNKGLTQITYNFLNLPLQVNKGTDYLVYTYDASGRKLKQQVFGTETKVTEYAGDFVYENGQLQFVNTDVGRIIMTTSDPVYEYYMKDHLGNNRLTFKGGSRTTEYMATFENDRVYQEIYTFENYPSPESHSSLSTFDHTDLGQAYTHSQLLTGAPNYQIGLAKSFEVNPGDIFDLEVYAKYENLTGSGTDLNLLFNALASVFSLSSTGGGGLDGQQAYQAFNDLFSSSTYIGDEEPYEDEDAPKAFLNYILFDENFNLEDFGFDQIDYGADQNNPHDRLSLNVKVHNKGYLYIFLSNENPEVRNVYFDDLKIVHHTAVEQVVDYYPFGLTFNSYTRENTTPNQYKFNGKEEQDELNLGWLDFGARMYQPEIGRWGNPDPLADAAHSLTPFRFGFNNPVRFVDPNGMYETDGHYWTVYLMGIMLGFQDARQIASYAEEPDNIMSDGGDIISSPNTWMDRTYQSQVHSLTGGLAADERQVSMLYASSAQNGRAFGYALHRLGDSYAHTMINDPTRVYPNGVGHGMQGHAPDKIARRPGLYSQYVQALHKAMKDKFDISYTGFDFFTFDYIADSGGSTEQNSAVFETEVRLQEGVQNFSVAGNQVDTINKYLGARNSHCGNNYKANVGYVQVDSYTKNKKGEWVKKTEMRTVVSFY